MSPKLKSHQNKSVTKTKMSQKMKCPQNLSVPKTEISPILDCTTKILNFYSWSLAMIALAYYHLNSFTSVYKTIIRLDRALVLKEQLQLIGFM